MERSDIEADVRNEGDEVRVGKYKAEVNDEAKTIKLEIPGGVKVVLEFDDPEWCVFYAFVWKVNNTLTW